MTRFGTEGSEDLRRSGETERRCAHRVSDVVDVEREIARVRAEIERMEAQRKNLDRRIECATLALEVLEERKARVDLGPRPVPGRLRHAAADGFGFVVASLLEVVVFLLRVGPGLLLWATVIGVPVWMVASRRRHGASAG